MSPNERRNSAVIDRLGNGRDRAGRAAGMAAATLRTVPIERTGVRPADGVEPRLAQAAPRLLTHVGPGAGSVVAVSVPCVIGRSDKADLRLPDVRVSRWHARVDRHGAGCVIQDLGSGNGTFVNGKQVRAASLEDGDVIRVGLVEIVFQGARRPA